MNILDVLAKGGPSIWLLVFLFVLLSFLALTTIIERIWFWSKILTREREIVGRVLESARREWGAARDIARRSLDQPIGRFLNSALELSDPDPEIFQLALQASADEELAAMRRGEKILEAVIAISPLLGLLGTVLGLIRSLGSIRLGDLGTTATEGVTLGISDALGSTAAGLIIAILSLAFYRLFQGLVLGQVKIFRQAGNELELLYRKDWALREKGEYRERPVPASRQLPSSGFGSGSKSASKNRSRADTERKNEQRDSAHSGFDAPATDEKAASGTASGSTTNQKKDADSLDSDSARSSDMK